MAKGKAKQQTWSTKRAAEDIGVTVGWIRGQIAAGVVTPSRSSGKRNARYVLSAADISVLEAAIPSEQDASEAGADAGTTLARVSQLEAERSNLIAQVAWERAIAQEQQKALEAELTRTAKLTADLELQHSRIEALKALSALDRLLGRHKAI